MMRSVFLNPDRSYDTGKIASARIFPKTVHDRLLHTVERKKYIHHAKKLGFNAKEIRKFTVFWKK